MEIPFVHTDIFYYYVHCEQK